MNLLVAVRVRKCDQLVRAEGVDDGLNRLDWNCGTSCVLLGRESAADEPQAAHCNNDRPRKDSNVGARRTSSS